MPTKNEKVVPPYKSPKAEPYLPHRKVGSRGCSKIPQRCVIQCRLGYFLIKRNIWTRCMASARVYSSPARARMALRQMKQEIFEAVAVELPQYK